MRFLFSVLIWIYWGLCFLVFFFIVSILYLFTFPFDRFRRIPNKALKVLALAVLKVNPFWSFEVRGADPYKIREPTIVVGNHQSFFDLPLVYLLPWTMKWVAKRSLFTIPAFGWIIYMTGHIGIDRKSRYSAKKLDKLVKPVKEGIPAMIFPEGTRTEDGKLKPFKNGAFKLAERYNFNLLPVVLEGGYDALPAGSWKLRLKQHFIVSVLEPIEPGQYKSTADLKNKIQQSIESELNAIRHGEPNKDTRLENVE